MMMKKKKATFRKAVMATGAIAESFCEGVQALEKAHKQRIEDSTVATGSIALDEKLKKVKKHARANRWDYGIGLKRSGDETVLWLEVHHSAGGQADVVIKKLNWLRSWLRDEAPALDEMKKIFVWQLTNVESNPNDRRRRTLIAEKHGLRRCTGRLHLCQLD